MVKFRCTSRGLGRGPWLVAVAILGSSLLACGQPKAPEVVPPPVPPDAPSPPEAPAPPDAPSAPEAPASPDAPSPPETPTPPGATVPPASPEEPLPPGALVQGIDVSHFQGSVDWAAVASSGKVFAIVKATEGIDYVDPQFLINWSSLSKQDLVRGAYHFFIAHDDAKTQAEFFLKTVDLESGDLVPVLDVESRGDATVEQTVAGVQVWLDTVEAAVGHKPVLYTGLNFWNSLGETSQFSEYPLWIAEYDVEAPKIPAIWSGWTLWQYTQGGSVDGVQGEVDLNAFIGSPAELEAGLTID